ncbi:MAG: carbamoyltransferase HypF, partial [bacterium]|nr:carbamoyltransferase HypF [bacterium]
FINCTDCGPRFSIIRNLPYDRPQTTMKDFLMCGSCDDEYKDPYDRRYHAQPVSCYECGPILTLYDKKLEVPPNPAETACLKLKEGFVVAVKGLGGYHLACKASDNEAVLKLRELKGRDKKPFALMGTLEMISQYAFVSAKELELLRSPASPIVLLKRKSGDPGNGTDPGTFPPVGDAVAPARDTLGFMLPYAPLHLLMLDMVGEPLVMTSCNISDEPIIFRDQLETILTLCDFVLTNNRDIHIFADDSVARVFDESLYMVRRSRGFIPLPMKVPVNSPKTILAVGPMLKTTFTFLFRGKAIMSQYIGDTDSPASLEAEKNAISHFEHIFSLTPDIVVVDKHPGYPNRELAEKYENVEVVEIQHHEAHVGSLLAEKAEHGKIIGIAMDGTGYGDDGNIWGGEFFVGDYKHLTRFGHLKYLFMPSGDLSAKEPWRFALSILHTLYGTVGEKTMEPPGVTENPPSLAGLPPSVAGFLKPFGQKGRFLLEAISKQAGGILTSSCGRLFDAVACLLGLGNTNNYEGELPIKLQERAEQAPTLEDCYSFETEKEEKITVLNLLPAIHDIIEDSRDTAQKAYLFHRTLAEGIAAMAEIAREQYGIDKVGLTGGVFQNTLLLQLTKKLLEQKGFSTLVHSRVPPNDGGVSMGQALLAAGTCLA